LFIVTEMELTPGEIPREEGSTGVRREKLVAAAQACMARGELDKAGVALAEVSLGFRV
jgi:hypothetical protein